MQVRPSGKSKLAMGASANATLSFCVALRSIDNFYLILSAREAAIEHEIGSTGIHKNLGKCLRHNYHFLPNLFSYFSCFFFGWTV